MFTIKMIFCWTVKEGSAEVKMIMEDLLKRKTFETQLDEEIVFNQLDYNTNAIWSLLLAGGYLNEYDWQEDSI